MSDDDFPKDLAIRLASLLTEFLDYFRAGGEPWAAPREEYAQDVIDAEKALAEFDKWDEEHGG